MPVLTWDRSDERRYETGIDRGVVYPYNSGSYGNGVPWNGLINVAESASGGEVSPIYADNLRYLNIISAEELGLTVETYSLPDELERCFGIASLGRGIVIGQQRKKMFGFAYRTLEGNADKGLDYNYIIHIVFKCTGSPYEKQHSTVNDSPEATTKSLDISTTSVTVDADTKVFAITIDRKKLAKEGLLNILWEIEKVLYGTENTQPSMLKISDLDSLFLKRYLQDSSDNMILDSSGNPIESAVYSDDSGFADFASA